MVDRKELEKFTLNRTNSNDPPVQGHVREQTGKRRRRSKGSYTLWDTESKEEIRTTPDISVKTLTIHIESWTDYRPRYVPQLTISKFSKIAKSAHNFLICCGGIREKKRPLISRPLTRNETYCLALWIEGLLHENYTFVNVDKLDFGEPVVKLAHEHPVINICNEFSNHELRNLIIEIRFDENNRIITGNDRLRYGEDEDEPLVDGVPLRAWMRQVTTVLEYNIERENAKNRRRKSVLTHKRKDIYAELMAMGPYTRSAQITGDGVDVIGPWNHHHAVVGQMPGIVRMVANILEEQQQLAIEAPQFRREPRVFEPRHPSQRQRPRHIIPTVALQELSYGVNQRQTRRERPQQPLRLPIDDDDSYSEDEEENDLQDAPAPMRPRIQPWGNERPNVRLLEVELRDEPQIFPLPEVEPRRAREDPPQENYRQPGAINAVYQANDIENDPIAIENQRGFPDGPFGGLTRHEFNYRWISPRLRNLGFGPDGVFSPYSPYGPGSPVVIRDGVERCLAPGWRNILEFHRGSNQPIRLPLDPQLLVPDEGFRHVTNEYREYMRLRGGNNDRPAHNRRNARRQGYMLFH